VEEGRGEGPHRPWEKSLTLTLSHREREKKTSIKVNVMTY